MFKIIKKGGGNFWHNFNNGSKEVNLSDWEIVLDSVNQTVSLQMLNGANVPINSVFISDILIIDETDGSVEETFVSVEALRIRLVELNYTPYIVLNGFVPEAPIDGLTYGRKDAEWVEVSGGGSVGTLQEVTDNGNTIVSGDFQANFEASAIEVTNQLTGTGTSIDATEGVVIKTGSFQGKIKTDNLTAVRTNQLPDKNITFAGIDDIPTELSELNDDATHRLVTDTQISTWDGKQNALTETNFGSFINSLTAKNTLVDADEVVSDDSADSNKAKKTSWLNVWLNYLKPKADALYATISNLALKQDFATATTGSVISFAVPQIYNSVASPTSSNITNDLTGARIGVVQKFYSNKATEPTYPAGWVKLSGTYTNSVTNIIYAEWCEGSRVEYWIVKA